MSGLSDYQPHYVAPANLRGLIGRKVAVYLDGTITTGVLTDVGRSAHNPRHLRLELNGEAAKCEQSLPDEEPWRIEHHSPEAHIVYSHTTDIGGTQ